MHKIFIPNTVCCPTRYVCARLLCSLVATGCELLNGIAYEPWSSDDGWCPQDPFWWFIHVEFSGKVYVIQDIVIEVGCRNI